jgi:nucleosome binding factor SPN SPT16 subunit
MVIVFKDLNRQPHRITSIPIESLEEIKNWLDSCDILFSEGPMNLKWGKVIGKIKDDPEKFIQDGGWSILQDDSSEDDEVDQEDSSFHESEVEDDEDSEYGEEDEEVEDSELSGGESELSDKGLSWDELEKHAAKCKIILIISGQRKCIS